MKIRVNGSAGYQFEDSYIKSALFDYLADYEYLAIGDTSANDFVRRVEALKPTFTIDDVTYLANDEGIGLDEALRELENQLGIM